MSLTHATHTNICRMNANCARFVETKWNIGFAGSRSATKWDKLYACFILAEREQNNKKQSRLIPGIGQAKSKYIFIIYAHTHRVSRRKSNGSRVHLVNLLICWLRGIFIAIFSSLSLRRLLPKCLVFICMNKFIPGWKKNWLLHLKAKANKCSKCNNKKCFGQFISFNTSSSMCQFVQIARPQIMRKFIQRAKIDEKNGRKMLHTRNGSEKEGKTWLNIE